MFVWRDGELKTDSAFLVWLFCKLDEEPLYSLFEMHFHPSHKGLHAKLPCKPDVNDGGRQLVKAPRLTLRSNVELPFTGNMVADHAIDHSIPLIIIAASSTTRLHAAEVIHMQYPYTKQPGFVLAIAESEQAVGKKQFLRANFYTGKTVPFMPLELGQLMRQQLH